MTEEMKMKEKKQMEEQRKKEGTGTTAKKATGVSSKKEKEGGKEYSMPEVVVVDNANPVENPGHSLTT